VLKGSGGDLSVRAAERPAAPLALGFQDAPTLRYGPGERQNATGTQRKKILPEPPFKARAARPSSAGRSVMPLRNSPSVTTLR